MRAIARSGLAALSAAACLLVDTTDAPAQAPPATAPAAAAPAARPAAELKQVLGTVNGESITRGELVNFLSRYQIPAGNEEQVYNDAMQTLVNTHLVNQFLTRQGRTVAPEKIDEAVASLTKELKAGGTDLSAQLQRSGMSIEDIRKEYANRIRWVDYLNAKATDAELKSFSDSHKPLFNGTQVKVSHIFLKLDPKAGTEQKEQARQKLLGVKRDIEGGKTSFAEAANKFSEDPANKEGAGGDVGYVNLNSGFIEEFTKPAFELKKGVISDPVETPYGMHLMLVTDRKEGNPFDFEQNKPLVKQVYAADLQKNVLSSERKKADAANAIVIKPMPADLFPPAAVPTGATKPDAKK